MSGTITPALDVVIVNYNSGPQLRACLDSVFASPADERCVSRIAVVDNASTDDSMSGIEARSGKIQVIRNSSNLGFATACNLGAKQGDSPFILFLNPDTRLFPGAIVTPLQFMLSRDAERTGVCGIQLVDENGVPQRCSGRIPSARTFLNQALGLSIVAPRRFPGVSLEEFDHAADRTVDHVMGAFYFVRRELFRDLRGFDERFFVYLEDLDFSLRARKAGWTAQFLSRARAFHLGGGTSRNVKAERLFYALRSRILFSCKHLCPLGATAVLIATCFAEPFLRFLRAVARRSLDEMADTLFGYLKLYRHLPSALRIAMTGDSRS